MREARGRHRARAGALLGVAALLLTGCTGDDEEATPTTSTSTPTPATSSTPPTDAVTAPAMPQQAFGKSPSAGKVFVEHYIRLVNYALVTGDVDAYDHVVQQECRSCQDYIRQVRDIYGAGGYFKGGQLKAQRVYLSAKPPGQFVFTISAESRDGEFKRSQTGAVKSVPGEAVVFSLALEREGRAWRVADIIT